VETITDVRSRRPPEASVGRRGRDAGPVASDEPGRLVEPRALAALAVGLAFAGVDPPAAVSELAASGERMLLTQARDHVNELVRHVPGAREHARSLLEAAVTLTPGDAAVHVTSGPDRTVTVPVGASYS
jgi:hypothetical protein